MDISKTKINLDYGDLESVECEECKCQTFVAAMVIKKIPALVSPTGQGGLAPVQIYQCSQCAHVNKEFMPK
jgi:hypothetical protein